MPLVKKKCAECGKMFLKLHLCKGKFVCWHCQYKLMKNKMPAWGGPALVSLDDALKKVRIVQSRMTKSPVGYLSTPRCLIGKKVRIVLVEEEDERMD